MNFGVKTLVKAAAFAAAFAGIAAAQYPAPYPINTTNCCWYDQIPAKGVKLMAPGAGLTWIHVTAPIAVNTTWSANNYYVLDRDIDVMPGACLTVRPGTWIFGQVFQWDNTIGAPNSWCYPWGSSLIIQRGGVAIMKGTADSVIVLTGVGDDPRDIATLGPGAKGLFGGLIIAGRAPVSNYSGTGLAMEGMAYYRFTGDSSLCKYGGTDPEDSSGVYEYVSVRHGGCGRVSNSEINGITCYGLGSRTVMNHLEVMSNYDDGIEIFGGTVNLKHIVVSFCDDDMIDLDVGYKGKIQFAFAINLGWSGNRNAEWDGRMSADADNTTSSPTIANVTLLGSGKCSPNNGDNHNYGNMNMVTLADSLGGVYRNILIGDGPQRVFRFYKHAFAPAKRFGPAFDWQGVMAFNMGGGTAWSQLIYSDSTTGTGTVKPMDSADYLSRLAWLNNSSNKCNVADPKLRGVSRDFQFPALDPRPCVGSPALDPNNYAPTPSGSFFTPAPYVGAFDASTLWCDGWTKLSQAGVLSGYLSTSPAKEILCSNCSFDLCLTINVPNVFPVSGSFTLDNMDISNEVGQAIGNNHNVLPCGGYWIKAQYIPVSALVPSSCNYAGPTPAINYDGLHVLKSSIVCTDGKTYTGVSRIKVTQ